MHINYEGIANLVNNAYKKKVKYVLNKITYSWISENINIRNVIKNNKDILEYL